MSPFGAFFSLTIIIYMVHFNKYIKCKKEYTQNRQWKIASIKNLIL